MEYSIGWPIDERTRTGIDLAPDWAWTEAIHADGDLDDQAQVIDLTGLLRSSLHGELLPTWPADLRIIGRRVPRVVGEQAELGQDPNWRYGAFATNTLIGQVQWLDARHRTQAHVEDAIKELKNTGGRLLPMHDWAHNSAWLHLAAIATSLTAWLRAAVLTGDLALALTPTLRYRIFSAPACLVHHARTRDSAVPGDLAPLRRDQRRLGPAPTRLTSTNSPINARGDTLGTVEPPPTAATRRALPHDHHPTTAACQHKDQASPTVTTTMKNRG